MKIYLAAVLACAALVTSAQKPITGAFGYTLGSALPKEKIEHAFGNSCFAVTPAKKFRNFNMYCVNVAPISGKIYCVMLGYRTGNGDGKNELQYVLAILEKIYGQFRKIEERPLQSVYGVNNDKRTITITYTRPNFDREQVMIMYIDNDLYKQAENEKKQQQIDKTDASML